MAAVAALAAYRVVFQCLAVPTSIARQDIFLLYLLGHGADRERGEMKVPKVLIAGASGLVGEALVFRMLLDRRFEPVATARGSYPIARFMYGGSL